MKNRIASFMLKHNPISNRAKFALEFIGKDKFILDIGCATGEFAEKFMEEKNTVVGIDNNKDCIKKVQNICKVLYYDVREGLPFKDNIFDCIWAGEFIEHLTEKEGRIFLKECKRILKLKGILILTTPNPSCFLRINPIEREVHKKSYSPNELINCLEDIGFKLKAKRGLGAMTSIIGNWSPFLSLYGTYGVVVEK